MGISPLAQAPCAAWAPRVRGTTLIYHSQGQGCTFHHLASQNLPYLIRSHRHLLSQRNHPLTVPTATSPSSREQQTLCAALWPATTLFCASSALYFPPAPRSEASASVAIAPAPLVLHHTSCTETPPQSLGPQSCHQVAPSPLKP